MGKSTDRDLTGLEATPIFVLCLPECKLKGLDIFPDIQFMIQMYRYVHFTA
jgi:hypothetical protein